MTTKVWFIDGIPIIPTNLNKLPMLNGLVAPKLADYIEPSTPIITVGVPFAVATCE